MTFIRLFHKLELQRALLCPRVSLLNQTSSLHLKFYLIIIAHEDFFPYVVIYLSSKYRGSTTDVWHGKVSFNNKVSLLSEDNLLAEIDIWKAPFVCPKFLTQLFWLTLFLFSKDIWSMLQINWCLLPLLSWFFNWFKVISPIDLIWH